MNIIALLIVCSALVTTITKPPPSEQEQAFKAIQVTMEEPWDSITVTIWQADCVYSCHAEVKISSGNDGPVKVTYGGGINGKIGEPIKISDEELAKLKEKVLVIAQIAMDEDSSQDRWNQWSAEEQQKFKDLPGNVWDGTFSHIGLTIQVISEDKSTVFSEDFDDRKQTFLECAKELQQPEP